jgi:NADH-quinone oxidoreductase subunit G
VLPIGTFAETSGTFVNLEGRWQTFTAAARAVGDSRPGWKVLRVLGNLLGLSGFDFESSEAVRDELVQLLGSLHGQPADTVYRGRWKPGVALPGRLSGVALYGSDPIVRRAPALQQTRDAARTPTVY